MGPPASSVSPVTRRFGDGEELCAAQNCVGPSSFLAGQRTTGLVERLPEHGAPPRHVVQGNCDGVLNKPGDAVSAAGFNKLADRRKLLFREGDGDLDARHTSYHTPVDVGMPTLLAAQFVTVMVIALLVTSERAMDARIVCFPGCSDSVSSYG